MSEAENLAAQAQSLMDNDAFVKALDAMRDSAMEALVTVDPTDADAIRKYQATVRVVDDLRGDLEGFIRSGRPRSATGIA